jgi:selenocysteine lyase/cysteine desulfurase
MEKASELPGVFFSTNPSPDHSCAIANFRIEGEDMRKMGSTFLVKHNLYTTITDHKDVKGMRISPNVFTLAEEMEYLVEVIGQYAR